MDKKNKATSKHMVEESSISEMILLVRGKRVMLDRDLSHLYEVKAIALRQQVKRNLERFPDDFMFQLNDTEVEFLVSQNVIPSKKYLGGSNSLVFTEQGVAMLSSVLKSKKAIMVNIQIMRAFTKFRQLLNSHEDLKKKIMAMEQKYDEQFREVFFAIKKLIDPPTPKSKKEIGFHTKIQPKKL